MLESLRTTAITGSLALSLLLSPVSGQDLHLPRAIDYNPHPRIFETVLFCFHTPIEYVDGKKTVGMVYNGSTPGPTIEAFVGDKLIVHFLNLLPEPTTVHWHGIEMPAQMDGSHISQPEIPRFGYFRYEFVLNNAGTYWYHPHKNTNEQIEKGLHGALVVRDRRHDRRLRIRRSRERVVFLDDIKLDENYQIAPFGTDLKVPWIPWQRAEDQANSRPGNHLLVNGREVTDKKIPTLNVLAGVPYRLRFINVSSGEIFRLDIRDPKQKWWGIGSDQGLWNKAELIQPIDKVINPLGHHQNLISNPDTKLGVTLTPSDRAEVVILPEGKIGHEFFIEAHDFVKGVHIAFRDLQGNLRFGHDHFDGADDPRNLIRIKIVGQAPPRRRRRPWTPPRSLRHDPIQQLAPDLRKEPLPVFFGHAFPNKTTGDTIFFVKVAKSKELTAVVRAGKVAMPPMFGPKPMMKHTKDDAYKVKVGDVRYWEVVNFTGGDHNFHSHGFRFQHIDTRYVDLDEPRGNYTEKAQRLAFEDTIRIPKRPNLFLSRSYTIVRLAVQFDDSARPMWLRRSPGELVAGGLKPTLTSSGGWLVHCHFLEHARRGMMSFIQVSK